MLASFGAPAYKRRRTRRNPVTALDAFVIFLFSVVNNPLMATAFGAIANGGV
jgi:hypothetical protein